MSGNYVGIGNYADPEELETNDDFQESGEAEDAGEDHLASAGIIIHD